MHEQRQAYDAASGRSEPAIGNHEKGPSYLLRLEVSDFECSTGAKLVASETLKSELHLSPFESSSPDAGRRTAFRFLPISRPSFSRNSPSLRNRNGPATWLSVAPSSILRSWRLYGPKMDRPSLYNRWSVFSPRSSPFPHPFTVQSSPPNLLTPKLLGLVDLYALSGVHGEIALHFGRVTMA